jgi:hypothetical protein
MEDPLRTQRHDNHFAGQIRRKVVQTASRFGLALAEQLSAAALYAVFAVVLLALAHRLVARLTWRAALTLGLLPLCFTGSALLCGRVYAPSDLAYSAEPLLPYAAQYGIDHAAARGIFMDVASQMIPWRQAVRYALRQGEWPLWNPFILCGDPLAGSAQPAPYDPVTALSLLLPLALAFTFGAAAQLLIAALAAFLFLRDLGCREAAALFGAVGWAFSAFLAAWLEWPLGATVALLPLVVLGARRLVRQPGWPAALLLAAGLTMTVLAGHPESALHVVAVGAALGLAEAAAAPRRSRGAIAGWTAAAGALALALSAVYLLPVIEVLLQSTQWIARRTAAATTALTAAAPLGAAWQHLAASVVPAMADPPRPGSPPSLLQPLYSAYAGSALLGPALYGLVRGSWRGRFVLAALGLGGLCAGARMPCLFPLFGRLPLFSASINERLVFTGAFALVVLAALGVEAWLRSARSAQAVQEQAAQAAAASHAAPPRGFAYACALAVPLFAAALALHAPAALAGYPDRALGRWAAFSLVPLLAVALIAGLAALPRLPRRALGGAAAALVVVLAAERTAEMGLFYPTLPGRSFFPRVAPLDALPAPTDEPWRAVGLDYQLLPNQGTLYEIEDVRAYQAIYNRRFSDLLPLWVARDPRWYLAVASLERPMLRLMNVRYALTSARIAAPGWRLVASAGGSRLWENPRALPRAFVPRAVRLAVGSDMEVEEMKAETDFRRRAWIVPPGGDGGRPRQEPNGRGWVVASRHGLGLTLTARMRRPGWAVITETAWTGWRARLDGREVPLGIADHAFLALAIPEGWHEAELFYRQRTFELGLALSAAALVLIAGVSLTRRTRSAAATASPKPL